MSKILIVDDEPQIVDLAAMYLEKEGFETCRALDGIAALEQVESQKPDLMLLDIMLPGMDGWAVCKAVRAKSNLPIIMLTARGEPMDRVLGLELGADDYIAKPFHGREMTARVRAVLRRSKQMDSGDEAGVKATAASAEGLRAAGDQLLSVGDVELDAARHLVTVDGENVQLRAREFDLLRYLMMNRDLVLTRDQLLENVWGYEYLGDSRTVDVHIAHLRSRLADSKSAEIRTVWGVGYAMGVREAN